VIDGVSHYWLSKTKRWVKDKKVEPAANVVATPPVAVVPAIVPNSAMSAMTSVDPTAAAGRELAVANAAHSIQVAMQGLLNTMK
jgi:hypothetical protein